MKKMQNNQNQDKDRLFKMLILWQRDGGLTFMMNMLKAILGWGNFWTSLTKNNSRKLAKIRIKEINNLIKCNHMLKDNRHSTTSSS